MLCQSIQYKDGVGAKQLAWLLHTGVMGAMLAPMCFLGGPLLIRAAWYTAGVVGGLSTIAVSFCILKYSRTKYLLVKNNLLV